MPAPDITTQDRQYAYRQLSDQLQKLGKSAAQAGDMAKKVEMAAYNKAANQAHYIQLWQTSLRKAQNAIQGAQQQQAQQAQQQMAAQQQAQLAAQQQQLAAQQAQLAAQQQQLAAQQQAQQHQQAQRAALLQRQRQQQAAQQQAQLQQAQQYAAQQGAMPAPQQQYMGAPQQHPQVVQQAPQQMQYMQVPPQQAQQGMQFVRQPGAQQPMQYVQAQQPGGQQQQYVQVQQPGGQPQYVQAQQQFAAQPAGGHAMAPQYMQQPRAVQQGAPGSLQAQVAHAQQHVQPAAMGVPQHMAGRMQPAGAPQQPGMEQGFPAPGAGGMMAHAVPYDAQQAQQAQQQALPAASTTASSAPQAAGASRRQLVHEEAALQEFMRLHAAFNEPRSKALNIRDSENMLRWYADLAKRDPNQGNKLNGHIKKIEAILKLLKSERPMDEVPIKDSVRQAVKSFLLELKNFKDHLKRNAAKLQAAQQAGAAGNGGAAGALSASSPANAPASAGYLAMMDSDKLDGSVGSAAMPSGGPGSLPIPGSQPGAAKPAPARPPAAPGSAASVAAEAARQRQAAGAEQQRRAAAAAAPAGPPLPADPMQRLLAVAQQPCSQGEAAAVRSGFQRLRRVLQAEEQRQLAAQVSDVPTPPLPPEAQRLVARERAALEAAAAAAGATACSPVARGVVSAPCDQGFVAVKEEPAAAAVGAVAIKQEPGVAVGVKMEDEPAAKRARSASPDPFLAAGAPAAVAAEAGGGVGGQQAQQAQRQRSELERRVASECEEAAAALGGAMAMRTAPDSQESGCVAVACLPAAAQQQARESGVKHSWQLLTLRVPPGYPEQPPTAVFPRASCSTASATQATAAAMQAQLAAAVAEAFVARLAALPPPQRLLPLAQAWLEATREVSARLAARQAALE